MEKLNKDQLVEKLIGLFAETDSGNIDGAVAQAKDLLGQKAKWAKRSNLEQLFDIQIVILKDCSVPAPIVEMLQNQRGQVITKAGKMSFENRQVPFFPVIPRTYLSIFSQMPMVKSNDKVGYTHLNPTEITDVTTTPKNPYYIYDIEDGEAMRGKVPQYAEKLIKNQGRFGLTEVEVIALGIHTDVLSRHYVDAVGSRFSSDRVPDLFLRDGRPRLGWSCLGDGDGFWGAASCGSR